MERETLVLSIGVGLSLLAVLSMAFMHFNYANKYIVFPCEDRLQSNPMVVKTNAQQFNSQEEIILKKVSGGYVNLVNGEVYPLSDIREINDDTALLNYEPRMVLN